MVNKWEGFLGKGGPFFVLFISLLVYWFISLLV